MNEETSAPVEINVPPRLEDEDPELARLIEMWCNLSEAQRTAYQRMHGGINAETVMRDMPKIGNNDPCHCGSGIKYKKCCRLKDLER